MKIHSIVGVLLVPSLLAGCFLEEEGDEQGLQAARAALLESRQRWDEQRPLSYEWTTQALCYCDSTDPIYTRVVDDSVTYASRLGEELSEPDYDDAYTVSSMFDQIELLLDEKPFKFSAEYDATLGYPRKVSFDGRENIADDELQLTGSGFVAREDVSPQD